MAQDDNHTQQKFPLEVHRLSEPNSLSFKQAVYCNERVY
jgi:hypothetical protein